MAIPWKPDGYTSVAPYLVVADGPAVIAFLQAAFGAEPIRRYDRPDGSMGHAEVRIDDTVVMIGGAMEGWDPVPTHVHVYVPDVDVTYGRALAAGATPVQPPEQKDDPDRRAGVKGPGGTTWWIGTQLEQAP